MPTAPVAAPENAEGRDYRFLAVEAIRRFAQDETELTSSGSRNCECATRPHDHPRRLLSPDSWPGAWRTGALQKPLGAPV